MRSMPRLPKGFFGLNTEDTKKLFEELDRYRQMEIEELQQNIREARERVAALADALSALSETAAVEALSGDETPGDPLAEPVQVSVAGPEEQTPSPGPEMAVSAESAVEAGMAVEPVVATESAAGPEMAEDPVSSTDQASAAEPGIAEQTESVPSITGSGQQSAPEPVPAPEPVSAAMPESAPHPVPMPAPSAAAPAKQSSKVVQFRRRSERAGQSASQFWSGTEPFVHFPIELPTPATIGNVTQASAAADSLGMEELRVQSVSGYFNYSVAEVHLSAAQASAQTASRQGSVNLAPVTSGASAEPRQDVRPAKAPVGGSPAISQELARLREKYMVGKIAGEDLFDDNGRLIVAKHAAITPEVIHRAQQAGKMAELIVQMMIPGLDVE